MGRTSNADQRLMDAALSLVWEQSYGAVTIDDICRKAGVKKGSFYYFFDSKAELAIAALDRCWKAQKPLWDEQFSSAKPPLQRILDHCDFVYRQQVAVKLKTGMVPGCPFCAIGSEICKQDEVIRAKVCEILGNRAKYWESAINDAQREGVVGSGNATERARCARAYFEGLVAQARLHNDAELLASLGNRVREHILFFSGKNTAETRVKSAVESVPEEDFDPTIY